LHKWARACARRLLVAVPDCALCLDGRVYVRCVVASALRADARDCSFGKL